MNEQPIKQRTINNDSPTAYVSTVVPHSSDVFAGCTLCYLVLCPMFRSTCWERVERNVGYRADETIQLLSYLLTECLALFLPIAHWIYFFA